MKVELLHCDAMASRYCNMNDHLDASIKLIEMMVYSDLSKWAGGQVVMYRGGVMANPSTFSLRFRVLL